MAILKIPTTPDDAMDLGLIPCEGCNMGWGMWSQKETKTCQDTCEYWNKYWKNSKEK